MSSDRIDRHKLIDRAFHWVMALSMFALLITGIAPKLGVNFDWILIHWASGLLLTMIVLAHIVRAFFWQSVRAMWFSAADVKTLGAAIKGAEGPKPGKYSLAQRLMHHAVTLFCLAALATGLVMLAKIETPFWTRDPYLLSAQVWGIVYVVHGLAALIFVSLITLHIYFALRPEKLFYLRSMIFGWISRDEIQSFHDPELWAKDIRVPEDKS